MIWLFKRILGIGVMAALIYFISQYPIGNRPVKDYVIEFYRSPIAQAVIQQSKAAVTRYLQKDVVQGKGADTAPPMDPVNEEEREGLEKVLKQSR